MPILLKLVYRDFVRQRSMLSFALLSIMATCCLIVWFVASIDMSSFAEDNGRKSYFGEYDLVLCADKNLPEAAVSLVKQSPLMKKMVFASQQEAKLLIHGFEAALRPSGMGERRSPCLMAIGDSEVPFELDEGRWPQKEGECAVSSPASDVLGAAPGEKGIRKVKVGDTLDVSTAAGKFQLVVTGIVEQSARRDVRGRTDSTFGFGFGAGIGGGTRGMGQGPAPQQGKGRPAPPPPPAGKRGGPGRGRFFGGFEVSPLSAAVYVSPADMTRLLGEERPANLMYIALKGKNQEAEFLRYLENGIGGALETVGLRSHDTRVEEKEGSVSQTRLAGQAWSTIGVVIVASLFIIFTTLSMGVSEKIRNLAMLRTVGFTRWQVARYIILEGLALGVLGWLGGIASGWLLLTLLYWMENGVVPLVTLSLSSLLFSFACALFGALLASLLPAWRATRISPTESMARNFHALAPRKLFWSGLCGVVLLGLIPVIVFGLPFATRTRLLLFSTLGTCFLAAGFLLFIPWTVVFTESLLGKLVAWFLGIHPLFLSKVLSGNFWRTLGTTLALSIGLGLFTSIHIWGNSMLNMFWVPKSIPDVLVRFQEGVIDDITTECALEMPGIVPERWMKVSVAQPALSPEQGELMRKGGAMATNFVLMGVEGAKAFREKAPLIRLPFVEGSREEVLKEFSQPGARVCVIPETVSFHGHFHVGDSIRLERSSVRKRQMPGAMGMGEDSASGEYVEYRVVGVVNFAWVWFSKCAGVRVSAGRTAGLLFTPYEPLLKDFGALDQEFLWFDKAPGVSYATVLDYMQQVASSAALMNPDIQSYSSFSGGTRWDSGINKNYVTVNSNESLNNSLRSRSFGVLDAMAKMPLIVLILSTLAVVNTMVVSVRSRRHEMGVMRACGVTQWGLVRIILAEAILVGLCACVLSFCFGLFYSWLATSLVDYAPMFGVIAPPLTIPYAKLLPGYGLALAVAILAGVVPALLAGTREVSKLLSQK